MSRSELPRRLPRKSKPAFISKMGDVLEEADESGYWVELLTESGKVDVKVTTSILSAANELVAIAISSINTAKRNSGPEEYSLANPT